MNWKLFVSWMIFFLISTFLIAGCAQTNQAIGTSGADGVAGFWAGLWHGIILPVAFIISLFKDDIGIYEIHNSGSWYNFGFVLGTSWIFGSVLASKKRK